MWLRKIRFIVQALAFILCMHLIHTQPQSTAPTVTYVRCSAHLMCIMSLAGLLDRAWRKVAYFQCLNSSATPNLQFALRITVVLRRMLRSAILPAYCRYQIKPRRPFLWTDIKLRTEDHLQLNQLTEEVTSAALS